MKKGLLPEHWKWCYDYTHCPVWKDKGFYRGPLQGKHSKQIRNSEKFILTKHGHPPSPLTRRSQRPALFKHMLEVSNEPRGE